MKLTKHKLIFIAFVCLLLTAINLNTVLFLNSNVNSIQKEQKLLRESNSTDPLTLRVGTSSGPSTLELVDSWDSASNDVLEQVVETLFANNLSDINLPRINLLAESYWWEDIVTLQIKLREGILFHDGTPFNATAAKWNLDRLLYLTNCTGTNTIQVAQTQTLWFLPDGTTPIIDEVTTVGDYNITITLNGAFAPFIKTLSYINAGMISPTFHASQAESFIPIDGDICGTGAFKYDHYIPNIEVNFTRWDSYWRPPAYFEKIIYVIFSDSVIARNAMLSHSIDILDMYSTQDLALYEVDPDITVKRFTDDTGKPNLVYQYLGFNNEKYNRTWRKAMSYAFNYSYVIEELRQGEAVRAYSAISPGFGETFNESLLTNPNVVPDDGDITVARQTMVDMGYGSMAWTDAQWISQAEGSSPFATIRYTYNLGNTYREDLGTAITTWLKLIGCATEDDGLSFSEFLNYLYDIGEGHDHFGLYAIGWGPDYLDPYNMLDPIFNPTSGSNSAQVNDATLNALMASALTELDEGSRINIYKNIQSYIATQGYFHAPLYHPKVYYVHLAEIKGIPYSAMGAFYAYPIYRPTPGALILSSDADLPDDDGDFNLNWTDSISANNYTVYEYNSDITEINGSLPILSSETTDLGLALSGYTDGTYYFIVEANNDYGSTLSNCIQITVDIQYEHDLEVDLIIPSSTEANKSYMIQATVKNVGLSAEFGIELYLYLDEVEVNSSTGLSLTVGEMSTIEYNWTPSEYKTYNFTVYAPAVPLETYLVDNTKTILKDLLEPSWLDSLYITHLYGEMGSYVMTNFSYSPYMGDLYNESIEIIGMTTFSWMLDSTTRIMSGGSVFGDGAHTPAWIFTNTTLYDTIPIAVDGLGDHNFYVARDRSINLPGFGMIEVWELEDLVQPGGIAWYEKSTGILINGTFLYDTGGTGIANYSFVFIDTNADMTTYPPSDFTLSSNAGAPDQDGIFNLSWTTSLGANNYTVYRYSGVITEINGSLTLLADEITDRSFSLTGYEDGTYYFIVVAHNDQGDTLSNCISVTVSTQGIPGYNTIFIIAILSISIAFIVNKRIKTIK